MERFANRKKKRVSILKLLKDDFEEMFEQPSTVHRTNKQMAGIKVGCMQQYAGLKNL